MKRLIQSGRVPYGGLFQVNRPAEGMVGQGSTFDQLERNVLAYRRANGIPVGLGFSDELMSLVCQLYPVECKETDPRMLPDKPTRLRFSDVVTGTKVMVSLATASNPIVSPEEAARRANICAVCKYNVQFSKPCGGICAALKQVVKAAIGNRSTPRASELNACQICKCYLESAVWVNAALQIKPLSDNQKAQFELVPNCWKKASLL